MTVIPLRAELPQPPKLCKDCKFCKPDNLWLWFCVIPIIGWVVGLLSWYRLRYKFALCTYTTRGTEDLLGTPPSNDQYWFCSTQRETYGDCGRSAKLFEARR